MDMKARYGLKERHLRQLQLAMLGAIMRYDDGDKGEIHPGNLQKALDSLGLKFGDEIVDQMMVMCRTTTEGRIDYTRFKLHLNSVPRDESNWKKEMEKDYTDAQRQRRIKAIAADSVQSLYPFENREAAQRRELQAQRMKDHRKELHHFFKEFDNSQMSPERLLREIKGLGLIITDRLKWILTRNQATDVKFADILIALSRLEPDLGDDDKVAGQQVTNMNEATFGVRGLSKRRYDPWKNIATMQTSDDPPSGKSHFFRKKNELLGRSNAVVDNIDEILSGGTTNCPRPISTSRDHLHRGIERGYSETLSSQQRVKRQQIFAAIRKMDSGELTASQFKDRMMQIGIDLPPNIVKLLIDQNASGSATFNTFASAFERLLEEQEARCQSTEHNIDLLRAQILQELKKDGDVLALQRAENLLKSFDPTNTEMITLQNYLSVTAQLWPFLAESDAILVFNAHDPSGAGETNYFKFMDDLRGPISPQRRDVVHKAFLSLPLDARGNVSPGCLESSFDAMNHPDVLSGAKRGCQVVTEFKDTFGLSGDGMAATWDDFLTYYSNLSAMIESDEEFISLVSQCWRVQQDREPPPQHYRQLASGERIFSPAAAQHHGNILAWRQDESFLEKQSQTLARPAKRVVHPKSDSQFSLKHESTGHWKMPAETKSLRDGLPAACSLRWDAPNITPKVRIPNRKDSSQEVAGKTTDASHPFDLKRGGLCTTAALHVAGAVPFGVEQLDDHAASSPQQKRPQSLKDFLG